MSIVTTILHYSSDEKENETCYGYFYQMARKTENTKCSDTCDCVICKFCNILLSKLNLAMSELEVSNDCKNFCELEMIIDEKYNDMDEIDSDLYTIQDSDSSPELSLKKQKMVTEMYASINEYVDHYHVFKNLPDDLSHLTVCNE